VITQPDLRPVVEGVWQLMQDWSYEWDTSSLNNRLHLPAGFRCDLASVPRWIWTITGITPSGIHEAATLVHDWIYSYGGRLPPGAQDCAEDKCVLTWELVTGAWTREQADRLFGRMLRELGVGTVKRKMMEWAVWMFGWWGWRK